MADLPNDPYLRQCIVDPETRVEVIEDLDKSLRERGDLLLSSRQTLSDSSELDLVAILSATKFERSATEISDVYRLIINSARDTNIPPYVIDHLPDQKQWVNTSAVAGLARQPTLGRRCFIACGLFRKALEYRHKRKGAPKPEFYSEVGKQSLYHSRMEGVSNNFENWTNFLNENLSPNRN